MEAKRVLLGLGHARLSGARGFTWNVEIVGASADAPRPDQTEILGDIM